ncbi:MAG: sulfatase [Candidatus Micrarchaeota archaeon]|nr:sulfatase [Candidatus Micrarchaeota archaeon]MDE1849819.1 sulfatase [Candidatus Micrarchaeota archaeon]
MKGSKKPNIVMIMLDTFRADYLSDYGGEGRLKTMEGMARSGVVYKNAYSPGTYTVPSHAALFLNKRVVDIPSVLRGHKVKLSVESKGLPQYIRKREPTLARKLSDLGYETALFSSNPFIAERTGFGEGFHVARDTESEKAAEEGGGGPGIADKVLNSDAFMKSVQLASHVIRGDVLDRLFIDFAKRMERRLARDSGYADLDMGAELLSKMVKRHLDRASIERPKFVFINYMEAHEPYPLVKADVIQGRWLYMGGLVDIGGLKDIKEACGKRLVYLDAQIGKLIDMLRGQGLLDDAFVILMSDHGQAFMEHGQLYHDLLPYNEMVRIPLVISRFVKGMQVSSRKVVEDPVGLTLMHDFALDVARGKPGKAPPHNAVFADHIGTARWWGSDIVKRLHDRSRGFARINEMMELFDTKATAVYYKRYKLIHYYGERRDELYDLDNDPAEVDNIINGEKEMHAKMRKMVK